ncbi:hypothetical protein GYMLUDRAFT_618296 [Collybiopsis luxurians FD-317 M1]|uniref:Uncharacterized protein n=1 Tax=Collybiopsis luxurians FD-317 M1 TaxID=944289 RepID=A0A0D0CN10_9AGAR|nr:hypothetical protein GYMLUDRAFT_618296 [Collybiopsis luxurians FD-317 M1]
MHFFTKILAFASVVSLTSAFLLTERQCTGLGQSCTGSESDSPCCFPLRCQESICVLCSPTLSPCTSGAPCCSGACVQLVGTPGQGVCASP